MEMLTPLEPLQILPMDSAICVGFGYAAVERDREAIWCEEPDMEYGECWTVSQAEAAAEHNPEHDWRILLIGPLSEGVFQRQGPERWVKIFDGPGFA